MAEDDFGLGAVLAGDAQVASQGADQAVAVAGQGPEDVLDRSPQLGPAGSLGQEGVRGSGQDLPGEGLHAEGQPCRVFGEAAQAGQQAELHFGREAHEHLAEGAELSGCGHALAQSELTSQGPESTEIGWAETGQMVHASVVKDASRRSAIGAASGPTDRSPGGGAAGASAGWGGRATGGVGTFRNGREQGRPDELHQVLRRVRRRRWRRREDRGLVPGTRFLPLRHFLIAGPGHLNVNHAGGLEQGLEAALCFQDLRLGGEPLEQDEDFIRQNPAFHGKATDAPFKHELGQDGDLGVAGVQRLAVHEGLGARHDELELVMLGKPVLHDRLGGGEGLLRARMQGRVHLHCLEGHGQALGDLHEFTHGGVASMGSDHSRLNCA